MNQHWKGNVTTLFNPLDYDTRPVAPAPGPEPRPFRLFSNGTMASIWQQVWCDQCARDHTMHGPDAEGPGCPIYCDEMMGGPRRHEIVEQEQGTVCNAFVQCDEGCCQEGEHPELRATREDPTKLITERQWCAGVRARCGPFAPVIPYEERMQA